MDNEPELIRQQMEETRASLTEKLETLENHVVGSVEQTTTAVVDTVESVKDAVQESVGMVTGTVNDAITTAKETIRETFALRRYVDRHPWASIGAAVAVGYAGSWLLRRRSSRERGDAGAGLTADPTGMPVPDRKPLAAESRSATGDGWIGEAAEALAPELAKLKSLSISATMALVRDMLMSAASPEIGSHLKDIIDGMTTRLGAQPLRQPLISQAADPPRRAPEHSSAGRGAAAAGPLERERIRRPRSGTDFSRVP